MTLISVVIPVYNGENTIKETINSVINQTHKDLEIIVINDGSTDSTLDIIQRIEDPRLRVFSYANKGLPASRNRGITQAKGEFISFLDADDLWTENKLRSELTTLLVNSQADVAHSWTDYIDEQGKFLFKGHSINLTGNAYPYLLLGNMLDSGSNLFVRREKLLKVGNYDESLPSAHDWDLYLRLATQYEFVTVPQRQILYRLSTKSMSTNIERMEKSCLKVIDKYFSQAPQSLQYLKKYSLANLYKYLTHKSLGNLVTPEQNLISWQMLKKAVKTDPSILYNPVIIRIIFTMLLFNLLPSHISQQISDKVPQIKNTNIVKYTKLTLFPDSHCENSY